MPIWFSNLLPGRVQCCFPEKAIDFDGFAVGQQRDDLRDFLVRYFLTAIP
jgi:hypothetical protein